MKQAMLLLRIGLAFVFLYAALSSFLEPLNWVGYIPSWVRGIVPEELLLTGFSVFEIVLALWLLSGKYTFVAALVSAGVLFGLTVVNLAILDVVFRDVGLVFAALALALLARPTLDNKG